MDVGKKTLQLMASAQGYNLWLFKMIEPYLGVRVLEVGAGIGTFTKMLLESGAQLKVVDIEKDYLENLKEIFPTPDLKVVYGDIQKKSFGQFDTVFCFNVLEHLEDDETALKNIFKSLKRGGKIILLVPAHKALFGMIDQNLGHKRRYTKNHLFLLLKSTGFKIKKISYLNALGAIGWLLNSRILRRASLPTNQLFVFNKISPIFLFFEKFISLPFGLSILTVAQK